MPTLISLICANGNHRWERESQRGRRPASCPAHPTPASEMIACAECQNSMLSGHNRRFCGPKCRNRYHSRLARAEGRVRPASRTGPWSGTRRCRYCDVDFAARSPRAAVCYARECQRQKHADRMRDYQRRDAAEHGRWRRSRRLIDRAISRWEDLDLWACAYCDAPFEHIDHVIPRTAGGTNHPTNLVPACARCNWAKGDRPALDFIETLYPGLVAALT